MRYRRVSVSYAAGRPQLGDPWGQQLPAMARAQWRPPLDCYETASALVIKIEVAGLSDEDFEIALYDDALVVEGERPWRLTEHQVRFHAVELRYGPFRVELPVPPGLDREAVEARYERGLLYVILPKGGAKAA